MQRKLGTSLFVLALLLLVGIPAFSHADIGGYLKGSVEDLKVQGLRKAVPAITFFDDKKRPLTLEKFRGRTVLLMLWATWCPYCRTDMPHINELQTALGGDDFTVLPISVDSKGPSHVRSYYNAEDLNALPVYMDPESNVGDVLGTGGLPYFVLIDKEGREVGRIGGETNWNTPEARALIKAVMAGE